MPNYEKKKYKGFKDIKIMLMNYISSASIIVQLQYIHTLYIDANR